MTDWADLTRRAGHAGHDLVGWLMWDPGAIARYEALGVPDGAGWIVGWRLAPLGAVHPSAAAAATYSIDAGIVAMVLDLAAQAGGSDRVAAARDAAVVEGLDQIAPGLAEELAPLADDLWRGVESVHFGARPLFAAFRAEGRSGDPVVDAWRAANCLRELRGDNHWALCASADLDAVEVGLLHSVMVDLEEYGDEEWIARSRGNDDAAIAAGWARLQAKGFASAGSVNDDGRAFRLDLEDRTDRLTEPAWRVVGASATRTFCEAIEAHRAAFLARIDATAGPRWMPAVRSIR